MIEVCENLCDDCPFSRNSMRGFLADYTLEEFKIIFSNDLFLPCHKLVTKDIAFNDAENIIKRGELKLCRGYCECMKKSAKLPRDPEFAALIRNITCHPESMSLIEFINHSIIL